MTRDDNRGIDTVEYNVLNLPQRVAGGGQEIQYVYDATGAKLAKTGSGGTQYYAGAMVYDETDLSYMLHDEGMVRIGHSGDARSYTYFYHLKDHLGNTRVEFQANPDNSYQVTQRQSYYPFGLRFEVAPAGENEYLYNGKQIQQDLIAGRSLGWYDYGARMYDAALARFHTIDPKAEEFSHQSPFVYADNNPIRFIDFKGENAEEPKKESFEGNAEDQHGNKGLITTEEIAIQLMAEVGPKKEVSSYIIKNDIGDIQFYVQDYSENTERESFNQPVAVTNEGTFKTIEGKKYEVIAQVHTHLSTNDDYEGPSINDANVASALKVSVFSLGKTELSKIKPGYTSQTLSKAIYQFNRETNQYEGPKNTFKVGKSQNVLSGKESIFSFLKL